MLAARDQENLVHGHQAAAASKPLNQGIKQLAPKTPANKVPKTPFRVPLNDEDGEFGLAKTGLKANGRGNENIATGVKKGGLGDKNAFVTPMGPRTRAPLGAKTTNAKAKAFQTPAPLPADHDNNKPSQKTASSRKAKPRVSHANMEKVEISGDKDELEEREIEYMPPRSEDMPDLPDDHFEINRSLFENGGLTRGAFTYFQHRKGEDGLSHVERDQQSRQRLWDIEDKKNMAQLQRDFDSMNTPCTHYPECLGEVCKDTIKARKAAEEQYQKTLAEIDAEAEQKSKKPAPTKGPSTLKSKSAATALSQLKTAATAPKAAPNLGKTATKPTLASSLLSRPKKTAVPTNPSSMHHTAAIANSKTTMGRAQGRSVSATLRKTEPAKKDPEPKIPDQSLAPALYIERYGVPRLGSDKWIECKRAGCFDEDEDGQPGLGETGEEGENALDRLIREQAEEEFVLTF